MEASTGPRRVSDGFEFTRLGVRYYPRIANGVFRELLVAVSYCCPHVFLRTNSERDAALVDRLGMCHGFVVVSDKKKNTETYGKEDDQARESYPHRKSHFVHDGEQQRWQPGQHLATTYIRPHELCFLTPRNDRHIQRLFGWVHPSEGKPPQHRKKVRRVLLTGFGEEHRREENTAGPEHEIGLETANRVERLCELGCYLCSGHPKQQKD
mmetsp:Transcript_9386/g.22256  ORF Transcript_9386/g.22256 Transcript_9386/m.22256 type:complete len:210 (+) Transcript_9386:294-923(+)